jgi:DNA repair exonuclease SbcCD ATPase subunit
MLNIEELRISATGRFVDEQVIEFNKLGNLVQVDGFRADTGGSSGSGKSTIFNALDFVFGLKGLPASVLQSRFTKDPITVSVKGTINGVPYSINRGKKLTVELDGTTVVGSAPGEEKIDAIIGMPRDLFRPLLHKRQKEGGFFLQFTPKEIHDFLTDALGLGEVRKKAELVDKKIKELETEIVFHQQKQQQAEAALTSTNNALDALGMAPVKEVTQQDILKAKASHEAAIAAIEPVKAAQKTEIEAIDQTKPQPRVVQADQTALKEMEAEHFNIEQKIDAVVALNSSHLKVERERVKYVQESISSKKLDLVSLNYAVSAAVTSKAEAARIALEIKKIRDSICPTCEQNWATEAAKAREIDLMGKVKIHGENIVKGAQAAAVIETIKANIAELEPQAKEQSIPMPPEYTQLRVLLDDQKSKVTKERQRIRDFDQSEHYANRVQLENFNEIRSALVAKHHIDISQFNGQIDLTRRVLDSAVQKMRSYEEAMLRYDDNKFKLDQQRVAQQVLINQHSADSKKTEAKLMLAEEIKRAIKGFTSVSFDEALEYIGTAATEIIRAIPNMANATIQLEGTKETGAGKIKEEVNAVLSMDGETGIPIKSLSGGERSSVDLAVDLAVIDLLENRSNKGVNIFILDEPFTGLDTVSIEMAIDKLKALNKQLIIVDHNPEIKQMVESRLLVVRDGLTSKIVQN